VRVENFVSGDETSYLGAQVWYSKMAAHKRSAAILRPITHRQHL